jgi:hypothetical protein
LPARLPDKVKKPKWAKPRKIHGKASTLSFTEAEATKIATDKAEQGSKVTGKQPLRAANPENNNSGEEVVVPATPLRPAGESQGGTL